MHTLPPAVHAMPNLQQTVDPDLTRRTEGQDSNTQCLAADQHKTRQAKIQECVENLRRARAS